MRRIIITALIALTAVGGVASADRGRDHRQGGVRVERAYPRQVYRNSYPRTFARSYPRTYARSYYVQPQVRVVRRPIYVQRPVIRYRYFDYYQPPTVLAENYAAVPGYYWVNGQWQWSGYEWIWQPGHYEPDPQYDGTYNDGSYYDGGRYYGDGSYPYSGY